MKFNLIVSAIVIALLSVPALAAKPSSFKKGGDVKLADGTSVTSSVVTCSDGAEVILPKIEKKWCTDIGSTYCSKKRMKAAKKACK